MGVGGTRTRLPKPEASALVYTVHDIRPVRAATNNWLKKKKSKMICYGREGVCENNRSHNGRAAIGD